jgi:hypothetical protein
MQFTVPQFIEQEDKIFGPFTFKQFLYMVGGAGGAYMWYALVPSPFSYPLILATGGLAGALAFYTHNDKPYILFLENAFYYLLRSKLYLWKHEASATTTQDEEAQLTMVGPSTLPTLSESKLKSLSWNLDINEYVDKANTAS